MEKAQNAPVSASTTPIGDMALIAPAAGPSVPLGTDAERIKVAILVAFPDYPVMVDVARAESRFRPWVDNESGSSASGLFQILDGTWSDHGCRGSVYVAEDNIACARKIVDAAHGLSDWDASAHAW